ncbi:MAG: hypothetical protein MUC50_22020 [Myxococcota bacterium]|jgi:hypothetical protein|nr:hypothetical protein [Myxococcota bacterium]
MRAVLERALRCLGSTALSLALLVAGSLLMLVGSLYAGGSKTLIDGLNETRLQDWLAAHLLPSFAALWWLPLLLAVLLALGLNGAACAFLRLRELFAARRTVPGRALFTALCPSLVHVGFLVVLLGHAVTFTLGDWRRVDLGDPGPLARAPGNAPLFLAHIDHEAVAEDSAVARQASRTTVTVVDAAGSAHEVRYMHPATVAGYDVLLDEKKSKDKSGTLQLFFVRDPGIVLIVPAFLAILALMTWYFVELALVARRRARR